MQRPEPNLSTPGYQGHQPRRDSWHHPARWDGSPCRCAPCLHRPLPTSKGGEVKRPLTLTDAARGPARAHEATPSEPGQQGPPAAVAAWTSWLTPVPWALQLHANARNPLGGGAWAYVLRRFTEEASRRSGLEISAFGCTQPNSNRERLHLHALIVATSRSSTTTLETPRDHLLQLDRWRTGDGLGNWLQRLLVATQPVWRPYPQPDNAGSVRLGPVTPRGDSDDPTSLVAYIVRYLLRIDAGDWLEAGDLSRVIPRAPDAE